MRPHRPARRPGRGPRAVDGRGAHCFCAVPALRHISTWGCLPCSSRRRGYLSQCRTSMAAFRLVTAPNRCAPGAFLLAGFVLLLFGPDLLQHLTMLGESTGPVLAPYLGAIHVDVKHAACPFDQLRVDFERFLDGLRQTGGFGIVVSLPAVLDAHFHLCASPHGAYRSTP